MLERLMSLDRRIIFLLVALGVIIPMLLKIQFPITQISGPTQSVFDHIERLPENAVVTASFDFGPSAMAELQPMALAVLRHCFRKNLRVIGMALWPTGVPLCEEALAETAEEFGKVEGIDYTFLGYRPGATNVILRMGEGISGIYNTDARNVPLDQIPMMQNIRNYDDISLVVTFGAGDSPEWWVIYAYGRYHQLIAAGVTGVIVSQLYPFIQTGQLVGLMPGLLGAAEYEKLIAKPAKGAAGMSVQSIVHLLIILLVILGNVAFFLGRRRQQA